MSEKTIYEGTDEDVRASTLVANTTGSDTREQLVLIRPELVVDLDLGSII